MNSISPGTSSDLSDLVTRVARLRTGAVTLEVRRGKRTVRSLAANLRVDPTGVVLRWDVSDLKDGTYRVAALAPGGGGVQTVSVPFVVDREPPVLQVVRTTISHGRVLFRLRLDEPATVRLVRRGGVLLEKALPAGESNVRIARGTLRRSVNVRFGVRDLADNAGRAVRPAVVW